MEKVILECFKNFKCRAGACKDNCCIGWEIDIDSDTLSFYDTLGGDFKKRLSASDSREDVPHFILDKNERCPFLNSDNLCDIIINLGEDKIPYICRNHPRFYTWLPDRTEVGMGICCEEAAELLFSSEEKLSTYIPYALSEEISDVMSYARDVAFSIVQNRNISLSSRLALLLDFCDELDEYLFFEDTEKLKEISDFYKKAAPCDLSPQGNISETAELFCSLEPINSDWTRLCGDILQKSNEITAILPEFSQSAKNNLYKYEHLSVYLIYRHFLHCLDDGDIAAIGRFIVLSVLYCGICDAYSYLTTGTLDTASTAQMYSKEVEYALENIQKISDSEINNIKGLLPLVFGR